jgi:holin-like protein
LIRTLATLLVFQAIGEAASFALGLPIPGPVIGMALLLGWLAVRKERAAEPLRPTAIELLRHLSLLFVPAGVGVMLHVARLADEWLPIAVALLASTALAVAVTALVIDATRRWMERAR